MRVKTKRKHGNALGDAYTKMPPKEYEVPDDSVGALIDAGLVEEAKGQDGEGVVTKIGQQKADVAAA